MHWLRNVQEKCRRWDSDRNSAQLKRCTSGTDDVSLRVVCTQCGCPLRLICTYGRNGDAHGQQRITQWSANVHRHVGV